MVKQVNRLNWKVVAQYGLIGGLAILYVCLVGMVEAFDDRDVIAKTSILGQIQLTFTLGRAMLVVICLSMGYLVTRKVLARHLGQALIAGLMVGLMSSVIAAILVWGADLVNLRSMFVHASPKLVSLLTFEQKSQIIGLLMLAGLLTGSSLIGALIRSLSLLLRRMIVNGFIAVLLIGVLQEFLSRIGFIKLISGFLFAREGLSFIGAIAVFVFFAGLIALWITQNSAIERKISGLPTPQKQALNWGALLIGIVVLLVFPEVTDPFITQIVLLIGLYVLMGLGLNIDIGFAGLLDLGYVGFYAIGAYVTALLTSEGNLGIGHIVAGGIDPAYRFWLAIPIAVIIAAFAGGFLGIPVLRMRGDYLAIVTLGFAEIIRILVLSDFLRPILGGAQGILQIPNPAISILNTYKLTIKDPSQFYYLALIGCIVVAFISWRLQHVRTGRNWMAMREDEDVAEAMGINLVANKLLAFSIGAGFAGLSGAISAAKVGSVFPHSFGLIVSINVLALIIIGGVGNIPGVIVGSVVLVGLPEILREFDEFRLLIYGALLVAMMLIKPEGFWPSEVRRRELHADEAVEPDFRSEVGESTWEVSETAST